MLLKLSKIFKNRLTRNIFLFSFGSQVVITGLLLFFIFTYLSNSLSNNLKQIILTEEHEIVALFKKEGLSAIETPRNNVYIRILDENNHVLYQSLPKEEGNYDLSLLDKATVTHEKSEWLFVGKDNDEDKLMVFSEFLEPTLRLQVGKSTAEINGQIEKMLGVFIGIVFPFLLVSFILASILAGKITVQLDEVASTILNIKSGLFNKRARVDQTDLKDIVTLFNKMMDQLELLILKNRDELDHFAHDIKTPVTRFKLIAEKALIDRSNPALALEALEEATEAAEEITTIISSVFDISLTESGAKQLHRSYFYFREVVEEAIEVYELVANEKEMTLNLDILKDGKVNADRQQIKRVLSNLLDNAVKYGKNGSAIQIVISAQNEKINVSVKDQGIGISRFEMELLWNRFFRGENAKNLTTGYGLGLSFAKAMVEAHDGILSVESTIDVGTTFTLSLPEAFS